jgi:hypothetical protein
MSTALQRPAKSLVLPVNINQIPDKHPVYWWMQDITQLQAQVQ